MAALGAEGGTPDVNVRLLIGIMLSILGGPTGLPAPGPAAWLAWLGAVLAFLAAWGLLARRILLAGARRGDPPRQLIRRHGHLGRLSGVAWLGAYAALLFFGRWPDVTHALFPTPLWLVRKLLVLAPMLLIVLVAAWGSYRTTAVLRRALAVQGFAQPGIDLRFRAYLVFQVRQQLLIILVPYVFVLGMRDAVFIVAGPDAGDPAVSVAVLAVYVLSPLMLRWIWPTEPLPPGAFRDRLMRIAERAGTRVRDVVVWHTGGFLVNACLAGMVRPLRYVFLTDTIVERLHPSQVEAVFGHELGHARFRHVPFYFLVAVGGGVAAWLVAPLLYYVVRSPEGAVIVVFALYWGVFFGILSRRFERQSDLLGARLVVCPGETDPAACTVHHPDRPPEPDHLCPYQAWAFTSALARIAALNGASTHARSWRHGSIDRRMQFIGRMVGRPQEVRRFNRRLRTFKILFIGALAVLAGIAVALYQLGWIEPV
jgi:STE24 endopeptidase